MWRCKDEIVLTHIFLISWEAKLFGIRCCLRNLQSNTRRLSWNRPKSNFVRWSNNLEQHLALKLKLKGCRSWTQRWNAFNPFLYHPKDQFLYSPKDLWNWSWLFWDKKGNQVKLKQILMQIFMLYFQLCFLQLSDIYILLTAAFKENVATSWLWRKLLGRFWRRRGSKLLPQKILS